MIPASLHRALVDACGPHAVIVEEGRLLVYESDGLTAHRHMPAAVVLPKSTAEVQEAVKAISAHGLSIVPRGAGTGLSGGAVALGGGVVIGTARMNRILEIDPENRRALLQPGVVNADLSEAARPHGLYYAPDPSSQTTCTIGGNVAENSGGPHCLKYGVTSRYVTGLTVVLSDGSVVELGTGAREDPGYDLVGLFVGSEGCFGIATEVEVALLPLPEGVRTLLGIFDRLEHSGSAVSDIISAGLLPAAMEIIDGETIRAVEDSVFAAGYPTDAEAALVIEFDGPEAGLDEDASRAAEFCRAAGAREVRTAKDENERLALWKGRKKAFGAMGRIAPDLLVQDATVPRTSLPAILKGISEIGAKYELTIANVFHAGDGNLHPNLLFDRRNPDELERVEKASKEIMQLCVDAGGTITGEHGIGLDKKHHMPLVYGEAELTTLWGLRRAFDPDGTMNPGKVLPEHTDPRGAAEAVSTEASPAFASGTPA
ncbi:MAG: FAD-linked oxidase C-terminal domain-containing protein [Longimicrobiales bacterium]